MPHHRKAKHNRIYTDAQTAHLERGLELDAADLSIKSLSDKAAAKSAPTSATTALEALGSSGEAPRHDGFGPLLATCSKISNMLLNLSEDIKFAIGPGLGGLEPGEPSGRSSVERLGSDGKANAKAGERDTAMTSEASTKAGDSGAVKGDMNSKQGFAPETDDLPQQQGPEKDQGNGSKGLFKRGRLWSQPNASGRSSPSRTSEVLQGSRRKDAEPFEGVAVDAQRSATEGSAAEESKGRQAAVSEGEGGLQADNRERIAEAQAMVREPDNAQDSTADVKDRDEGDGGELPEGLPPWMRPTRFVEGLGGEPRLPPWQDAATRLAAHLEQLQRVLSPSPVPLGLAVLFSGSAFHSYVGLASRKTLYDIQSTVIFAFYTVESRAVYAL
jgi:hypothetical protein